MSALDGRSVLVVEDEPLIGIDVCATLEAVGATTLCLTSLARALQALQMQRFDAAILDYRLPDGFSTDLCAELDKRNIPYIIHTGYGEIEGACSEATIIEKPANPVEIVRTIEKLLSTGSPPAPKAPEEPPASQPQ